MMFEGIIPSVTIDLEPAKEGLGERPASKPLMISGSESMLVWGMLYTCIYIIYVIISLVGVSTPLKNKSQLGWLFPIYGKTKKIMFQTTNQWLLTIINHLINHHYPILNQCSKPPAR